MAAGDLTALMKVPGIGRKGAQRIVLELTDRLGAPDLRQRRPRPWSPSVRLARPGVDALVGLGWSAKQAADAVEAVAGPDDDSGAPADVPGTLRAALRHLGRSA